jgi:TRAP-type C4-dicarboxylate transport system permease small subunit
VSDPTDDDSGAKVREDLEVPATRKQELEPEPEQQPHAVLTYPDDGKVSALLRKVDGWLGVGEQAALLALLAMVVGVAATHAILDRIAHIHLEFKDEVIRGGTYAIAMLGMVYASQQARHLSMDLISRRLAPRARLVLKVVLGLFTIGVIWLLMIRAGYANVVLQDTTDGAHEGTFSPYRIVWMIPLGGALVIVHTALHLAIDIDYLARSKAPPERMRSGH